ncbi:MAG: 4-hydroxy-tetrahydrodipicolinate synthase [Planctomycetes bacterium]|nr:4-hydroxy-tetrahydrodipicolinate synthase [Planctomycetota bacterium]
MASQAAAKGAAAKAKYAGVHVALVTPFKEGRIDFDRLGDLIDFHVEKKTRGIVLCGTTGESATLSHKEHESVIEFGVKRAAGKTLVIAGTGSNNTVEAVALTRFARKAGADAALVITPYYNKPTQEGLAQYFRTVAEKGDLPIIMYNVPSRTAVNMTPETCARLAEAHGIVAIKEAAGSLDQVTEIVMRTPLEVLSGDDSLTLPMLAVGAVGVVSVVANVLPVEVSEMVNAFFAGATAEAAKIHRRLYPVTKALFLETNPIPVKTAMALLGRIDGELRSPLCAMSEGNLEKLKTALREFNFKA